MPRYRHWQLKADLLPLLGIHYAVCDECNGDAHIAITEASLRATLDHWHPDPDAFHLDSDPD